MVMIDAILLLSLPRRFSGLEGFFRFESIGMPGTRDHKETPLRYLIPSPSFLNP